MKTNRFNLITLCLVIFFSVGAYAQDYYFLNKKGQVAEYAISDAKGNVQSYVKTTVMDVETKDAKNYTLVYSSEVMDKNKKSLTDPVTVKMEVIDGKLVQDPVAAMGEAGNNVEIEGNFPEFPAKLTVGEEFGEYSYKMKMMGSTSTVKGSSKVVAKEELKTPAGSFDTFKVESESTSKVLITTTKVNTTSWYAENVGAVRTETYDKKGKVQSVQELVSLK